MKYCFLIYLSFCFIQCSIFSPQSKLSNKSIFGIYDLYLHFGSKAAGPPSDKIFIEYLNKFENQYQIKVDKIDKIGPLGREGEYDLGIVLNSWNETQKRQFIDGVKKIVWNKVETNSTGYVQISENIKMADLDDYKKARISTYE